MKLSLKYLEKALELQNKLDDNLQEAKILNNISGHYLPDGSQANDTGIDMDKFRGLRVRSWAALVKNS